MEDTISTLINSLFGHLLEPELINEILSCGVMAKYKEGDIVLDINQKIESIPLMLTGSIKIMREDDNGNEIFLYYIESGSICAASLTCCMNSHRSNILAIVEEDATFLAVPTAFMDIWMAKYRSWRSYVLSSYALRYDELLEVVDLLAFKRMDDRVANYLQEKASLHQTNTIRTSHQDIAHDLNTSREVVSRILKQMERDGNLELKRGHIVLS